MHQLWVFWHQFEISRAKNSRFTKIEKRKKWSYAKLLKDKNVDFCDPISDPEPVFEYLFKRVSYGPRKFYKEKIKIVVR